MKSKKYMKLYILFLMPSTGKTKIKICLGEAGKRTEILAPISKIFENKSVTKVSLTRGVKGKNAEPSETSSLARYCLKKSFLQLELSRITGQKSKC